MSVRRTALVVMFAAVMAPALAACGGGGGGGKTVNVTNGRITVEARDYKFDVGKIETTPGPLDVTLIQKGQQPHTFVIEGISGFKPSVDGKKTDQATVDLQPGEYKFYCDVPGHRSRMHGTITVQ
jgi:plastocyanin